MVVDVFEKRETLGTGTLKKDLDRIAARLKRSGKNRRSPEGLSEIAEMLNEAEKKRNDVVDRR